MYKLSLKEAMDQNMVDEFIEQNHDENGDREIFDLMLKSMINKSKSTRQTSTEEPSES